MLPFKIRMLLPHSIADSKAQAPNFSRLVTAKVSGKSSGSIAMFATPLIAFALLTVANSFSIRPPPAHGGGRAGRAQSSPMRMGPSRRSLLAAGAGAGAGAVSMSWMPDFMQKAAAAVTNGGSTSQPTNEVVKTVNGIRHKVGWQQRCVGRDEIR